MDLERLGDGLPHGDPRVERRIGVLEDHLGMPPERTQLTRGKLQQVDRLSVRDRHLDAAGRWLDQPEERTTQRRLTRTGTADQPERLTGGDREAHVVHGPHLVASATGRVDLAEPFDSHHGDRRG